MSQFVSVRLAAPDYRRRHLRVGPVRHSSQRSGYPETGSCRRHVRPIRPSRAKPLFAGIPLAIDEINAAGGVLGKKVALVVRDDESNPAKGVVAARELVQREDLSASSVDLIRRSPWPSFRSRTRPRFRSWASGRRARRSPRTARRGLTCFASPRSTNWWTSPSWITPSKNTAPRSRG